MTLSGLIKELRRINEEVGCDGERIASHNSKSSVRFVIEGRDDLYELELDHIDVDMRPGCGCWDGVVFRLKEAAE